jgi:hypothetical protein
LTQESGRAGGGSHFLRRGAGRNAASLCGALAALLVPKCPLCLAAWAGAIGLGAAPRRLLVHWWSVPLLIALLFLPALGLAILDRPFRATGLWWTASAAVLVAALSLSRL